MRNRLIFPLACVLLGALLPFSLCAQRDRKVSTGASYLGVGVADLDAERAKALNLKEERGVEVKSVDEESPAAKAGLKEGDVILEYNGERIQGMEQLVRMVKETPSGRPVKLQISRNGSTQTVTATMGSRQSRGVIYDGGEFRFEIPPIPPIPPMPPEMPRALMAWRNSLGIESETLGPQLAEFFGVKEGVLVRSVVKNSAAEKAGIKAGDVIVKVDDTKVSTAREISSILRAARSKTSVPVVVVRDRKEMTVTVAVEDGVRFRGVGKIALTGYC